MSKTGQGVAHKSVVFDAWDREERYKCLEYVTKATSHRRELGLEAQRAILYAVALTVYRTIF